MAFKFGELVGELGGRSVLNQEWKWRSYVTRNARPALLAFAEMRWDSIHV